MLTQFVQRWRDRRGTYRPAGEPIATHLYEVADLEGEGSDATAKAFVARHHYSGTYPAARFRFGLYRRSELVGVAVFSQPANNATLSIFPGEPLESVELGRLVLLDDVPANGESWFVARALDRLRREGLAGVVSFSDPFARQDADGHVVFRGHVGTLYQASNAIYMGRARVDTLRLLPDGSVMHSRALAKIRGRERGWRYSAAILERFGAAPLTDSEDARAWLDRWLPILTRKVRHPGNLKYAFALTKQCKRHLPASLPYLKFSEVAR